MKNLINSFTTAVLSVISLIDTIQSIDKQLAAVNRCLITIIENQQTDWEISYKNRQLADIISKTTDLS